MVVKKKIFISARCMEIGGIERSLLGLLDTIDYGKYDVDLFLMSHTGPFMSMIPSEVTLLPEIKAYSLMDKPIWSMLRQGFPLLAAVRLSVKAYASARRFSGQDIQDTLSWLYQEFSRHLLPPLSVTPYDLAISFQGPTTFLHKVKAVRKVGWVHTDYSALKLDAKFMTRIWRRADVIAAVSESCREVFTSIFHDVADRVIVIENILSPGFIRRQAREDVSSEMPAVPGLTRLCTVGRYSHPKGFDRAVSLCEKLIEFGCHVHWYAVGPEKDHPVLTRQIRDAGMEKHFTLLGEKINPYPYIAASDIYVQPSRFEGKAVTVREAQILGRPVVISNFPTASSQLQDGFDGVIIPMDIKSGASALKELIDDNDLLRKFTHNSSVSNYGNESEVDKITHLIKRS